MSGAWSPDSGVTGAESSDSGVTGAESSDSGVTGAEETDETGSLRWLAGLSLHVLVKDTFVVTQSFTTCDDVQLPSLI